MESALLCLPSNEPGDILNVSHALKFANCMKKKRRGGKKEETRTVRSRSNSPTLEVFAHASGFCTQT